MVRTRTMCLVRPAPAPLICYEIIFPGAVIGSVRPGWLVNVTDDSWFGPWAGPWQHLLTARMRAIEEGLPVVRSANTGISAVIDPLGRIVAALGLDETGEMDFAAFLTLWKRRLMRDIATRAFLC